MGRRFAGRAAHRAFVQSGRSRRFLRQRFLGDADRKGACFGRSARIPRMRGVRPARAADRQPLRQSQQPVETTSPLNFALEPLARWLASTAPEPLARWLASAAPEPLARWLASAAPEPPKAADFSSATRFFDRLLASRSPFRRRAILFAKEAHNESCPNRVRGVSRRLPGCRGTGQAANFRRIEAEDHGETRHRRGDARAVSALCLSARRRAGRRRPQPGRSARPGKPTSGRYGLAGRHGRSVRSGPLGQARQHTRVAGGRGFRPRQSNGGVLSPGNLPRFRHAGIHHGFQGARQRPTDRRPFQCQYSDRLDEGPLQASGNLSGAQLSGLRRRNQSEDRRAYTQTRLRQRLGQLRFRRKHESDVPRHRYPHRRRQPRRDRHSHDGRRGIEHPEHHDRRHARLRGHARAGGRRREPSRHHNSGRQNRHRHARLAAGVPARRIGNASHADDGGRFADRPDRGGARSSLARPAGRRGLENRVRRRRPGDP
ncbi:MAG: hypothetical protein BWZ10_01334 [candidate division BRC1 bacterium ADurb.BinA364]|nr:MAG: hypothetical protein BWZ10_01334 [candidate division BRC1 bacterium ADurb.BinA364]